MAFTERERQILVGLDLEPQTADEGALQAFAESCQEGGGGSSLPEVSGADNGDTLTVVNGAWAKTKPTYLTAAFHGTINAETGAVTITDHEASSFYDACSQKLVTATFTFGEATVVFNGVISAQKAGDNYDFAFCGATGVIYATGHLTATDAVVFTPVTTNG